MEGVNERKVAKQKMSIFITLCIIAMISMIGYTYSFFQSEISNTGVISGEVSSVNLQLTVTKVAPSSTKKLIPQLDSAITKAVVGRNGSCIDDNNNAVCQVYKITLKNASSSTVEVDGYVELNAGNNPNLKWAQVSGDGSTEEPTLESEVNSYPSTTLTTKEFYQVNETKTYYIVIWISETGYAQMDSGQFTGVVRFGTHQDVTAATTLTNLKNLGFEGEVSETELTTFTTTSKLDGTTGIYSAEDDLGTSYYFRGNITNNYVKFGQYTEDAYAIYDSTTGTSSYASSCGDATSCIQIALAGDYMYWRIVRINGDGTVRMIYTGTSPYENSDETESRHMGKSKFNINSNDNAYVGYMYGTAGSTTYEDTHANINDSSIKTTIDRWYSKYLNTNYSSYIADAIYCNDRTNVTDETLNTFFGATGEGFGTNVTLYSLYGRTSISSEGMPESVTPTLKCQNENDRFTTNPTVGTVTGDDKLTYPVGLITADELAFAGGYWYLDDTYINEESYLFDSTVFWAMSPGNVNVDYAGEFIGRDGAVSIDNVSSGGGVRLSVSLKSDAIKSGTGTTTDPFTIFVKEEK